MLKWCKDLHEKQQYSYIHELVQKRRNSSALAMELRLFCANPSIFSLDYSFLMRMVES